MIQFNATKTKFECREDEAAVAFGKQIIQDSIFKVLKMILTGVGKFLVLHKVLGKEKWKSEYKESEEIVNMLYINTLGWIAIIFFPAVSIMQPVILLIMLKAYFWHIMYFVNKPISQSNKDSTGVVIMYFMNVSFYLWIGVLLICLVQPFPHYTWVSNPDKNCGPIPSGESF